MSGTNNSKAVPNELLLKPAEAAKRLSVSLSWLAKSRMRGDGPPFTRIGRAVRYGDADVTQWLKQQKRYSTRQ